MFYLNFLILNHQLLTTRKQLIWLFKVNFLHFLINKFLIFVFFNLFVSIYHILLFYERSFRELIIKFRFPRSLIHKCCCICTTLSIFSRRFSYNIRLLNRESRSLHAILCKLLEKSLTCLNVTHWRWLFIHGFFFVVIFITVEIKL